jgi:hypothetical protein
VHGVISDVHKLQPIRERYYLLGVNIPIFCSKKEGKMIDNAGLKLCLEYYRKVGRQPPWFVDSKFD